MNRRELLRLEVPFGTMAAVLLIVAVVFAVRGIPAWIPPALIVRLGIASPLTGMTRSFVSLASGHIARALYWHPLGPLVFVACVMAVVVGSASWIRGRRIDFVARLLSRRTVWLIAGVVTLAVWVRQIAVFG